MMKMLKTHIPYHKLMSMALLALFVAGCSHEGFKRAILVPAAVERQDRERELKANALVVPPKWHASPSKAELAKKAAKITDAPLYTADNKKNPDAVEPDIEAERKEERIDQRTPDSGN